MDQKATRPIWLAKDGRTVRVIDQRLLPHEFVIRDLKTVDEVITAIQEMYVRGAPLIGVTGAMGAYLAVLGTSGGKTDDGWLDAECRRLAAARPTAVNLAWGVARVLSRALKEPDPVARIDAARDEAGRITEEEVENCRRIGEHGAALIGAVSRGKPDRPVNVLTHCNAGWLACIEYGTATAPIYTAHDRGIPVHVWVDETRPLNQGARLTAWELQEKGVPHTVITDNAGGHLMQHGQVDLVIVGTDRTTRTGDVANKIGTYLKALAARDNHIPFYVALPSSTFDWNLTDGLAQIPIEERDPDEVRYLQGMEAGEIRRVLITPPASPAANYAFDITPARLVTGLITERGVCRATAEDIHALFPDKASKDRP